MPALSFTNQEARLRRILDNALAGARYDSSEPEEGGRMLLLRAHRDDGRRVNVRFRGVSKSEASLEPQPGAALRLRSVDVLNPGCLSVLGLFFPRLRSPGPGYARVRIEAGASRLEVVCQDAEWWEGDAPGT
jgi:hypothetical protein